MIYNNIERSKLNHSEVNQNVYNFYNFENLPKEAIQKLKEMYPKEFKNSDEEIKKEIENLYKEAMTIINKEEASLYISSKDKYKLKNIYQKLEFLETYYKTNTSSKDTQIYYHNLFVMIALINLQEAIEKFQTFPKKIKESIEMQYLYSAFLVTMGNKVELEEAEKTLEDLYFDQKCDIAFESLVRCYFLQKKFDKVIEILTKAKKEQFDKYGFLASIFLISKNYKKQLKEQEVLKFNNKKFKDMPLFYAAKAQVLNNINPKNPKIKEQFIKGLKLLTEKDVIAISTMCDVAISINLNEEMIKFLQNIELTPYLKLRLAEFLINKPNLSEKEIDKLKEIKEEFDEQDIDVDFIDGVILENQGQEIKAIEKYEKSYNKKGTINSAYKYIQLSRKNFCEINDEILKKLSLNKDVNTIMLVVEGYKYKNDFENAIKNSYKALYLLNNNITNKEVLRQYCGCNMLGGFSLYRKVTSVGKDVGITLKSEKTSNIKDIVIEDDNFYQENRRILNVEIIRSTSELGLELINKKINDKIEYKNQIYKIVNIKDKYTFFHNICFEKIKDKMNIEILTSNKGDEDGLIKQIEQRMVEIQKDTDEELDEYENGRYIPLSVFGSPDKTIEDYYKTICTILFIEKDRMFYAGESKNIDIENGFVIDLTSIIILALLGKLDVFTPELCQKVYITTSLKNKIKYYYESLLKKQGQKEMTIGIYKQEDGSQKLAKNETEVNKMIDFCAEIYKCINRFNVENAEAVKDDIWNEKTRKVFDKVQFDLIALAKQKNLPYICDDSAIKAIANDKYKVEHSNCLVLIEYLYKDKPNKYIDIVLELVKYNYIYAIYGGKYIGNIFVYLYKNYNEENRQKVENIIKEVLKTKKSFDLHIKTFINMINILKGVQYTIILDKAYINGRITDIINMLIKNIQEACNNLKLNYEEYEKYITKEIGGIEFTSDND